jgi:sortase A
MLCLTGGVLLSVAGGRYTLGELRADQARRAWNDAVAQHAAAQARLAALPHSPESVVPGAPTAHLMIPKIGLDEIVLQGVAGDELDALPGHVPGSAVPGERGNAVISAHRDRHFRHLDELGIGDTIITESLGRHDAWVVVSKHVIDKNAPALFQTPDPTLTLTTCWPIRYFGAAPDRLIITAKRVGPRAAVGRG